jgi:hypothetical protein
MHFETDNVATLENPYDVINYINDEAFYAMSERTQQSVYNKPNSPARTASWPKQEGFILVFWRCSVQILAEIATILTDIFCGFSQPYQANDMIVPQIRPQPLCSTTLPTH